MAVEPEKVVLVEGSSPFKYPDARRGELVREMVNSKNETVLIPEPYDWYAFFFNQKKLICHGLPWELMNNVFFFFTNEQTKHTKRFYQ